MSTIIVHFGKKIMKGEITLAKLHSYLVVLLTHASRGVLLFKGKALVGSVSSTVGISFVPFGVQNHFDYSSTVTRHPFG